MNRVMSHRIAIWGATGFIGRHIANTFLQDGWKVRALGRTPTASIPEGGCEFSYLDFSSPGADIARALQDVECAIHCSGHYEAGPAELEAYVASVRKFAEGARQYGVEKILLVSSIAVYGTAHSEPIDVHSTPLPETPYAVSRWRAEEAAREVLADSAVSLVVVRVPAVIGVGMRSNVLRRFFGALKAGVFFHPGRPGAVFACVGVTRLADCIVSLANQQRTDLPPIVQPVDCVSWVQLAERFCTASGRRMQRVGLPVTPFHLLSAWIPSIGRMLSALDSVLVYKDNCKNAGVASVEHRGTLDDIDSLIQKVIRK